MGEVETVTVDGKNKIVLHRPSGEDASSRSHGFPHSHHHHLVHGSRTHHPLSAQGDEVNPESWTQLKGSNETHF